MTTNSSPLDWESTGDPLEDLQIVWTSKELSLGQRARALSELLQTTRLTSDGASRFLGAPAAEVEAMVALAGMEDEDLHKLSIQPPPKTTWFLFANISGSAVDNGLKALQETRVDGQAACTAVFASLRMSGYLTVEDKVLSLSPDTLLHAAKKAMDYKKLSDKSRKAITGMANQRKRGKTLSPPQCSYLFDLLGQLVQEKVISEASPDGDQEHCDAILNVLAE